METAPVHEHPGAQELSRSPFDPRWCDNCPEFVDEKLIYESTPYSLKDPRLADMVRYAMLAEYDMTDLYYEGDDPPDFTIMDWDNFVLRYAKDRPATTAPSDEVDPLFNAKWFKAEQNLGSIDVSPEDFEIPVDELSATAIGVFQVIS